MIIVIHLMSPNEVGPWNPSKSNAPHASMIKATSSVLLCVNKSTEKFEFYNTFALP